MKGLKFLGSSLAELKSFPRQVGSLMGYQLQKVQFGKEPDDWKPMKSVGPGVREIRIHCEGEWRAFYVANFPEAIYVLHAFHKKTPKTSFADVRLGQLRYRDLLQTRRRQHEDQDH